MHIEVTNIGPPIRPRTLARVSVTIHFNDQCHLILDDLKILRNSSGGYWVATPTASIPIAGNEALRGYIPVVGFNTALKLRVEEAVLPAFERWLAEQSAKTSSAASGNGGTQ